MILNEIKNFMNSLSKLQGDYSAQYFSSYPIHPIPYNKAMSIFNYYYVINLHCVSFDFII